MSPTTDTVGVADPRLSFTEDLNGFVSPNATGFDEGYRRGEAEQRRLTLHLTIQIERVFDFVKRLGGVANATGYVSSTLLGGEREVEEGRFQLFVMGGAPRLKHTRYRLFVRDDRGEPRTLSGFKTYHDDPGLDVLGDASTLFTRVLSGHVNAEQEYQAQIVAVGIVRIDLPDFLRQLSTFRVDARNETTTLEALGNFFTFYLGNIWDSDRQRALDRERG
jgi:cholesterol oxidase